MDIVSDRCDFLETAFQNSERESAKQKYWFQHRSVKFSIRPEIFKLCLNWLYGGDLDLDRVYHILPQMAGCIQRKHGTSCTEEICREEATVYVLYKVYTAAYRVLKHPALAILCMDLLPTPLDPHRDNLRFLWSEAGPDPDCGVRRQTVDDLVAYEKPEVLQHYTSYKRTHDRPLCDDPFYRPPERFGQSTR